jgi:hypothetical protein
MKPRLYNVITYLRFEHMYDTMFYSVYKHRMSSDVELWVYSNILVELYKDNRSIQSILTNDDRTLYEVLKQHNITR